MIAYIEGRLAEIMENSAVVITTSGVGYEVFLPGHTLSHLPEQGGMTALYTEHVVREDAQELFGFETWDERQTFVILTSISKVGARTALAMLSIFRPDDLRRLVFEEDANSLTRVPGIGKKTAQHVFLELKYKLKVSDAPNAATASTDRPGSVYRETLTGLAGLGYTEEESSTLVKGILHAEPDLDVSEALRAALKALAKGRG